MGCCLPKIEIEQRMMYHYHNLNLYEMDKLLHQPNINCYLCKQVISHRYEQVTVCNATKRVIGHRFCVSMYYDSYSICPACHKSDSTYR
jgi:hypothetical protein